MIHSFSSYPSLETVVHMAQFLNTTAFRLKVLSSKKRMRLIIEWSIEFNLQYVDADWEKISYPKSIENFVIVNIEAIK